MWRRTFHNLWTRRFGNIVGNVLVDGHAYIALYDGNIIGIFPNADSAKREVEIHATSLL